MHAKLPLIVGSLGLPLAALGMSASAAGALSGETAALALAEPTAAVAPAPPQEASAALTVHLVTMDAGDAVWERFGHNAIWIRDAEAGTDLAYNYGMFDFDQEHFILRFMRGEMLYWMAAHPMEWTIQAYAGANRTITVQELALTPEQRAELQAFLRWNEREENRHYRYDYYLDNCSTRIRDAIDRALGGLLRRELSQVTTATTFRSHTQRLTAEDLPISTGLLLALGQPVDQRLDAWEESFIPMQLMEHVRGVRVPDGAGGAVPLVRSERVLFQAVRPPPPQAPPERTGSFLLAGVAGGGLLLGLGRWARRARGGRVGLAAFGTAWSLLQGVLGAVILGLWLLTEHSFTYRNENVLQASPLGLVVAALVPLAVLRGERWLRPASRIALLAAGLSLGGALLQLLPGFDQVNGPIVALALPLHVGLAAGLLAAGGRPRNTHAGSTMNQRARSAVTPAAAALAALLLGACGAYPAPGGPPIASTPPPAIEDRAAVAPPATEDRPALTDRAAHEEPRAADPVEFVEAAERRLAALSEQASRASWVQATYITHDTELLASRANEAYLGARTELAAEAGAYASADHPFDVARKLDLLRVGITTPAPRDSTRTAEVARLSSSLEAAYGRGRWCPEGQGPGVAAARAAAGEDGCLDLQEMTPILAESRDEALLRAVWTGWRTIAPPMREDYRRFAELMNEGARELGFADTGELWRSGYDMPASAFALEVDRLWQQVAPLYEALHCHVRGRLGEHYGADVVPRTGPIPAHLLGNMWAQQWGNIYDLVAPDGGDAGYDLTELLREEGLDARGMVRTGEAFFTSMAFEPLPETFWERSLFTQPRDRDVVCHASAWNIDSVDDLRIKMCIDTTAEDFRTIHHELGHNFYQRAYNRQPFLYQDGAHDGFHEAIGDAIALSITPPYLVRLGLLDEEPPGSGDLGLLLRDALDKVAFLPFGLLVDQWRWRVFSGDVLAAEYNRAWWELRERYQGVAAPVERSEEAFDPGAKYHVPGNTPYTRYFLAHILQFQFHRALCAAAGYEGPLHRCTVYGSEEAGRRLAEMLELGRSRPWPDALEAMTGSREMDATAILDYFAPLHAWLEEQNRGRGCGW